MLEREKRRRKNGFILRKYNRDTTLRNNSKAQRKKRDQEKERIVKRKKNERNTIRTKYKGRKNELNGMDEDKKVYEGKWTHLTRWPNAIK